MTWELALAAAAVAAAVLVLTSGRRGRRALSAPEGVPAVAAPLAAPVRRLADQAARAARSEQCEAQVPEMLDVLTLGLSAGLSFDASLSLYVDDVPGPLSDGLAEARAAWEVGEATRAEALAEAAERLESPALGRFAAAVTESLEFGTPLAATLQRQARSLREEQRRQVEESVEKVPVKLLGPLAGLVVPAMLLAILGPLLSGVLAMG